MPAIRCPSKNPVHYFHIFGLERIRCEAIFGNASDRLLYNSELASRSIARFFVHALHWKPIPAVFCRMGG